MSILREAHDRALRLHEINESYGPIMAEPKTSGDELPRDRDDYADPVITGHPSDVVDRYTYVAQMGVPNDEGTRGRSSGIVQRAARVEKVVEGYYDVYGEDLVEAGILEYEMDDEDEDEDEDEEDEDDGMGMSKKKKRRRGKGMSH